MKYALLIYSNDTEWESLSEDEKNAIYGEYAAISESARDHRRRGARRRRDRDDRPRAGRAAR